MKIRIESSGGIGNIRIKGELEFDTLHPELQQKILSLLDRWDREKQVKESNSNFTDGITYELTVIPDSNAENVRQIRLDESTHDRDLVKIGKDVLREIIKQKK